MKLRILGIRFLQVLGLLAAAACLHGQTISSISSGQLTDFSATHGNAITSGTSISGIHLFINGTFTQGSFNSVVYSDPRFAPAVFNFSNGVVGASSSQIIVNLPSSFFSAPVTNQVTATVTVREQSTTGGPISTSNPADFFVNPPLTALGPTLPDAFLNLFYSTPLTTGGTNPTVTDTTGTFPPGLSLLSVGVSATTVFPILQGTPTALGTFNFTVFIADEWNFTELVQNYTLTVRQLLPPVLSSLVPNSAPVCTPSGLTITVNGQNFLNFAVVHWSAGNTSVDLSTTYVSATQLTAIVPATLLQSASNATITVVETLPSPPTTSTPPAPLVSNGLTFSVLAPTIASLNPSSATAGSAAINLTVTGSNFVNNPQGSSSQILFGGVALTTTFVNSGTLTAVVPAALLQVARSVNVTVSSPCGVTSNAVPFLVAGGPILTSLVPNAAVVGGNAFTLLVNGSSFTSNQTIIFDGNPLATTFVTANQLRTTVPANLIATARTVQVSVITSDSVPSNSLPFTIGSRLQITTASLPNGIVGVPYTSTAITTSGGLAPVNITVTGLPPGLQFTNGAINGTPTTASTFTVNVSATDALSQNATAQFQVTIAGPLRITTASLPNGIVGVPYPSTAITTSGGLAPVSITVTGLPPGLQFTNGAINGTPTTASTFAVNVSATDALGQNSTAQFQVTIATPLRITTTSIPEGAVNGSYFAQIQSVGGVPPLVWSASGLAPQLSINPNTGVVSGTLTNSGTFSVTVSVRDAAGQNPSANFNLIVKAAIPPLQLTTTSPLPNGTVAVAYPTIQFSASGGTPNYTFDLAAGTLAPGLTLVNGFLSGTPTTAGQFRFTVRVTDSAGAIDAKEFFLTVQPPPLVITTGALADAAAGVPLSIKFAATGGVPPYRFSITGAIPSGTQFNTDTLSGTPTVPSLYTFGIAVTDSAGTTVTKGFTLRVTQAVLTITTASLPNGQATVAYTPVQLAAADGTGQLTWTATGVPAGMALSAGGVLSGTPTDPGSSTLAVTVTDASGAKATANLSLTITPGPLSVSTASLPNGVINVAYPSTTVTAAGGVQPYTFLISGLPAGLTASGATISGTPTATGDSSVTVRVTDSTGATASRTYTVTITPPPLIITTPSVPNATVGTPVGPLTFAATGGVGPLTFTQTGLPAPLAVSSAGVFSGTPAAPGNVSFTVTVTDSTGATANRSYTFTISLPVVPPLTISGPPPNAGSNTQSRVQVSLGAPFPVDVTVTLTLTFAADSGPGDPAVVFDNGTRTATIIVPAGQTAGSTTVGVQFGTTAGTVTITSALTASGQNVTPTPPPVSTIRITPAAPVITSVTAVRNATGFTVTIIGFANTREVTTANFTFTAAAGSTLQTTNASVSVAALFTGFFGSAASATTGGTFMFTQQFTVQQGTPQSVQSVAVTLTSAAGTSNSVSATLQ